MESCSTFLTPQSESLRQIGISAGRKLGNKLTITSAPFIDAKDAIKTLCKDVWYYCFRQQASRLQANRKGVFVIHDSSFPPLQTLAKCTIPASKGRLTRDPLSASLPHVELLSNRTAGDSTTVSSVASAPGASVSGTHDGIIRRAHIQLQISRGLIEGFMEAVGFPCSVDESIADSIPACAFTVTLRQSSSEVLDPSRLLGNVNEQESASI